MPPGDTNGGQMKYVVRSGGFGEPYLQRSGAWGDYETARQFTTPEAADIAGWDHGANYGVFPAVP
jgi:hypothetical protein